VGEAPNHLRRAAEQVDPRLTDFAAGLGAGGWQMTGSGSAFFRRCLSHQDAVEATTGLRCWTAVTCAVPSWA